MTTMKPPHTAGRFLPWMIKVLAGFCFCEIVALGLASIVFKVPLRRLPIPFLTLLLPALATGPLFYWTNSYADRPRLRPYLFAFTIYVFAFFFQVALLYSAVVAGLTTQRSAVDWIPYAIAGAFLAATSGYYHALRHLSSRKISDGRVDHP
jgi:hypothetical protein